MIATPLTIELVIDELVLHGFDPLQRHAIADAVQQELARLAGEHARELLGQRPVDARRLDGGSFAAPPRASAAPTGVGIAGRVFSALRGEAS